MKFFRILSLTFLLLVHFTPASGMAQEFPRDSVSSCDPKSSEFKKMLKIFPPGELNKWMLDDQGECGDCLHTPKQELDPKTGYLVIKGTSWGILGAGAANFGAAAWNQVLGLAKLAGSGVQMAGRMCVDAKVYLASGGKRNLFYEDARNQKAKWKREVFSIIDENRFKKEIDLFCKKAERNTQKISQDNAQFLLLQMEQCLGMGYAVTPSAAQALNSYYNSLLLPGETAGVTLDLKKRAKLSESAIVHRYYQFQALSPELNSSQSDYAIHGLDEILVSSIADELKSKAVNRFEGFKCLPSPYRALIEGKVAGSFFDPFSALKTLQWIRSVQASESAVAIEKTISSIERGLGETSGLSHTTEKLTGHYPAAKGVTGSAESTLLLSERKTVGGRPGKTIAENDATQALPKDETRAVATRKLPNDGQVGTNVFKSAQVETSSALTEKEGIALLQSYSRQRKLNEPYFGLSREAFSKSLTEKKVLKMKQFTANGNVSHTYLVELEGGMVGVFKPSAIEEGIIQTVASSENEVVASVTDEMFSFGLVPKTGFKDIVIDGKSYRGSFQLFSPNSQTVYAVGGRLTNLQKAKIDIFDSLINNVDRHAGNMLKDRNGNIIAIDNGASFINGEKRLNMVTDYASRNAKYSIVDRGQAFAVQSQKTINLSSPEIPEYLKSKEGSALFQRLKTTNLEQIRNQLEKALPELSSRELKSFSTRIDRQRQKLVNFLTSRTTP